MRKYLSLVLLIFIFACNQNDKNSQEINPDDTTKVEFTDKVFDFGTIIQGESVKHTYKFKNTGNKPLVINEVHSSCGCTVPSYSDEPIKPQSEGFIKVTFNSAGKSGNQYKVVTIVTNTNPDLNELVIKGTVKVPENR